MVELGLVIWSAVTGLLNAAGICFVLVLLWIFKRFPKVIGFMGRKLTMLVLIGALVGYGAGIVLLVPGGCPYAPFLFGLSFSMMFGACLCKAVAINSIFGNQSLKNVRIAENTQIAYVLLGAVPELALITGMHFVSPLEAVNTASGDICAGDTDTGTFLAALAIWHATLLLVTLVVARKTRHVTKRFQQHRTAGGAIAVHTLCVVIFLPMTFAPSTSSRAVAFSSISVVMLSFVGVSGALHWLVLIPFWENVLYPEQRYVVTPSPVRIASSWSRAESTSAAVAEAYTELSTRLGEEPSWLCIYPTVTHTPVEVIGALEELQGHGLGRQTPVHGASSCAQVMTENGPVGEGGCALGMWAVYDPEGTYHTVAVDVGDDVQACVDIIEAALRPLLPQHEQTLDLVWLGGSPGNEEKLLAAIRQVVGEDTPIYGGSSADNDITGKWYQFSSQKWHSNGAVISLVSASVEVSGSFFSGYSPAAKTAVVTKADGRNLLELDGRPAAVVYNEWTQGLMSKYMDADAPPEKRNILAASSTWPLGRLIGYPDDYSDPFYQLMHPNLVLPNLGINLFAEVNSGDTITLMTGTHANLQTRIANAAIHCTKEKGFDVNDIRGALVIYCAGCMLTIQSSMDKACHNLSRALGGCPFIGAHCFGEQGHFPMVGSKHGNLSTPRELVASLVSTPWLRSDWLRFARA